MRQLSVVILRTGRVPRPSCILPVSRRPALPGIADVITVIFKQVGEYLEFFWEITSVCARLFKLPDVQPGEDRRPGRAALRCCDEGIAEKDAVSSHLVKNRRMDPPGPVDRTIGIRLVIGNGKENIGPQAVVLSRPGGMARGEDERHPPECDHSCFEC